MRTSNFAQVNRSRLRPLAACLALAFSAGASASPQAADQAISSSAPGGTMVRGDAGTFADVAALRSAFAPFEQGFPTDPTSTLLVKNCNDDGSDSLRDAITLASDGSTIQFDMNAMACSTITLTTGQIEIAVDNLQIVGPGADELVIDGGYQPGNFSRILHHTGQGELQISYLTLTNAKYATNAVQAFGGCIYSNGSTRLVGATVTGCGVIGQGVSAAGGGVWARKVILFGSTLSNNVVVSDIYAQGGGVEADVDGFGAKYSTISNNAATNFSLVPYGSGGGIQAKSVNVKIQNSTISGNKAGFGGGLRAKAATIVDSTFSTNYASGRYGGIDVDGLVVLSNSTVTFNRQAQITMSFPAGIVAGSMQANSSIFAYNTQDDGSTVVELDAGSNDGIISGANNIILATTASTMPPPDTSTACPRLAPLLDNGGATRTHAILPGSAAMDAGNNLIPLSSDQRGSGFARVVGSDPDIGAYEWSESSGEVINRSGFENCN